MRYLTAAPHHFFILTILRVKGKIRERKKLRILKCLFSFRIFFFTETSNNDIFAKVAEVVDSAGANIILEVISCCHRLSTNKPGLRLLDAKFLQRNRLQQKVIDLSRLFVAI